MAAGVITSHNVFLYFLSRLFCYFVHFFAKCFLFCGVRWFNYDIVVTSQWKYLINCGTNVVNVTVHHGARWLPMSLSTSSLIHCICVLAMCCSARSVWLHLFVRNLIKFWILESRGNFTAVSNDMKLVHWPLTGGLLELVHWGEDWVGPQPTQAPPCWIKL